MLRKFKITYRAVKREGVTEIDAFSKYDAKQRFKRINPKCVIIQVEEVTDEQR